MCFVRGNDESAKYRGVDINIKRWVGRIEIDFGERKWDLRWPMWDAGVVGQRDDKKALRRSVGKMESWAIKPWVEL